MEYGELPESIWIIGEIVNDKLELTIWNDKDNNRYVNIWTQENMCLRFKETNHISRVHNIVQRKFLINAIYNYYIKYFIDSKSLYLLIDASDNQATKEYSLKTDSEHLIKIKDGFDIVSDLKEYRDSEGDIVNLNNLGSQVAGIADMFKSIRHSIEKDNNIFENPHEIKKACLVSRNSHQTKDFSEYFGAINKIAESHDCDTIIYAMWSYDDTNTKLTKDIIFKNSSKIKLIILETGNLTLKTNLKTQIWFTYRDKQEIIQRFARSSDSNAQKQQVIDDLFRRICINEGAYLLICGETNIVKYKPKTNKIIDEFNLVEYILDGYDLNIIINPIHDYMIRHEMKKKRQFLSINKRYVISVWNTGKISSTGRKISEPKTPWTIFYDGNDITSSVKPVYNAIPGNIDIILGIVTL
ncbi:hypothetical protein [Desulforhopalus singaporensis]|uniref:Uncharacterized protein n=1 Tax=Desulforhopalus singaporensis TaxID=91360 RepID=A0A1H0VF71_9BACT|nr:hypothetical protein [Desulforhopalus singaporensis]SDP76983.1 hypothetical protein SAMN05660330_04026 [Desulforhopalus singaporensis]